MTTKQIIQEMEKEFDERFLAFRDPDIVDGFAKDQIKSFIHSYTRKLIEAVAEEICPEWIDNPYGEVTIYSVGRRDERKAIRLKVKEILESL